MTAYELMIKTNHHLIKGGTLTDAQKASIVRQLLAARSDKRTVYDVHKAMHQNQEPQPDENGDYTTGGTYPAYYIQPYNQNKKYQTVIPMSPKTHILSMNAYELDILRLLHLFAPDMPDVKHMVEGTYKRLRTAACFGGDCSIGECFHSSLPTLRFANSAVPHEKEWMRRLVAKVLAGIEWQYKENAVNYFWLCLSELPFDIAEPGLMKYKNDFYEKLKKSVPMNTERAQLYQPVLYCVYRDCLAAFPEYAYIKNRQPYINEKDGRLCFDMAKSLLLQIN